MTQTIEEQVAILHPVAGFIRLRSLAEAVRQGKIYTSDAVDALSTRVDSERARALARIVLALPIGDTDETVSGTHQLEAVLVAREVLGL